MNNKLTDLELNFIIKKEVERIQRRKPDDIRVEVKEKLEDKNKLYYIEEEKDSLTLKHSERASIIKLINILFYPAIIIIMAIIAQIIFNN